MSNNKLRKIPIRRVGARDNLFLGGDRELVMVAGLLSVTLIIPSQSWYGAIAGFGLWFFAIYFLRKMAKADSKIRYVYLRHIKYKKYYAAHSKPYRENRREY